jgi:cbb3-type cytochrome oxidase maturation protein
MDEATIALTVMTGSLFLIFLGLFIWGLKTGQFKNVEEPKYTMLKDHEPKPKKEDKGEGS